MKSMIGWGVLVCLCCWCVSANGAESLEETVAEPVRVAEGFFMQGEYQKAIEKLHEIRAMAGPIPQMTDLDQKVRAQLFFDLGCCYLAMNDSTFAEAAFQSAFHIDSGLKGGFFKNASPGNFWQDLLDKNEQERRLKTNRIKAGMRSLFLPGWGQHYRGYNKKGWIWGGAAIAATGYWVMRRFAFQSERNNYAKIVRSDILLGGVLGRDQTDVQFDFDDPQKKDVIVSVNHTDDGGMYSEFEARHRSAQNKARMANQALFLLGGIWAVSVFDSIIWEPNQVKLSIKF